MFALAGTWEMVHLAVFASRGPNLRSEIRLRVVTPSAGLSKRSRGMHRHHEHETKEAKKGARRWEGFAMGGELCVGLGQSSGTP